MWNSQSVLHQSVLGAPSFPSLLPLPNICPYCLLSFSTPSIPYLQPASSFILYLLFSSPTSLFLLRNFPHYLLILFLLLISFFFSSFTPSSFPSLTFSLNVVLSSITVSFLSQLPCFLLIPFLNSCFLSLPPSFLRCLMIPFCTSSFPLLCPSFLP